MVHLKSGDRLLYRIDCLVVTYEPIGCLVRNEAVVWHRRTLVNPIQKLELVTTNIVIKTITFLGEKPLNIYKCCIERISLFKGLILMSKMFFNQ